jgi:hypothetical protein
MKALSVKQPWASLVSLGLKPPEIRSRKTNYRGPLMICSSQRPDTSLIAILAASKALMERDIPRDNYPLGQALSIVDLIDCRPMTKEDESDAWVPYQDGLWAWIMSEPKLLKPFPVKGRLGVWKYSGPCETCFKHRGRSGRIYCGGVDSGCEDWYPAASLFFTNQAIEPGEQGAEIG